MKGDYFEGMGRIEISVSGRADPEEFRELMSSNSYLHLRMYINTTPTIHNIGRQ